MMTPAVSVLLILCVGSLADELLPLHGGKDRGCQGIKSDSKKVEKWSAKDLEECKSLCSGSCGAVEWIPQAHFCELWHVPVAHTIKKEGAECYARKVDVTNMSSLMPKEVLCLRSAEGACSSLKERTGCLMSKDSGGPCVWCGGAACNDQTGALCESFGSWRSGASMAAVGKLVGDTEIARCEAGKPAVIKVKSEPWQIPPPSVKDLELLTPVANGCKSLSTKEECLNSKDASVAKLDSFKVYGEACIWCGGIACTTEDESKCGPFDYLMHGQGLAFDVFHAKHSFEVAGKSSSIKHANWNGDCLEKAVKGCPSLQDEYSCLASVDDRDEDPYHKGLKVRGQPCVWCNGGLCHSNGTNRCEVYDIQVHGQGKAFNYTLAAGITVAQCDGGMVKRHLPIFQVSSPPFPITRPSAISCLKAEPKGCEAIKNKLDCLSSVDGSSVTSYAGLRIKGEPCVWCGGAQCNTGGESLCAPFDFLEKGAGRAFGALNAVALTPAQCSTASLHFGELSCLKEAKSGCNEISDKDTCLASVDGRPYAQVGGYKVKGQPCVWCGGLPCQSGSLNTNKCEPYDFAVNGEGHIFDRHQNIPFQRAGCNSTKAIGLPVLFEKASDSGDLLGASGPESHSPDWFPASNGDISCLQPVPKCRDVRDKLVCLSSKDSELGLMKEAIQRGGDACVWCGGEPCTSFSDALCESFDWLHRGEGNTFNTFTASGSHKVAQCWHLPQPKLELSCLREHKEGCHTLKEATQCLSSFDGRAYERVAGFKVKGQPCVWCGGQACHGNNGNLCEPLDFALNGNGYAFDAVAPDSSKTMAGCQSGHSVSLPLPPRSDVIDLEKAVVGAKPPETGAKAFGGMVANYGKDCWWECQQKSGYCGFCGAGNACCREGEKDGPSECQGDIRFQTWHHECVAPVNGLVKAGAAAPKPATSAQSLVNIGKDCWWECGQKSGSCPFCGTGNACCRRGYDEDTPTECKGALAFTTWHHECVVPIHSESTELIERLAGAGAEAARLAAEKGMSQEQQVREAAMAIGKLAKAEGLSAQSAAQIAAAGAQEAAKKNGDSQLKQQELAIMAAALAATEAAQDSMPAEQKAAEIGLAVAESASAAGMSFEQQMEAASTAIGTFAADSGLSPQQAAKIAADGSRRAAKAANKDENQVAASAAAVAAAKAAGAGGKHGQELALIIAGAAAAASPGISPEEQFQVVRSALGDNAATVGLTPAELDAIAHQAVPAAKTAASPDATDPMAAGKAAASRVQSDKGTPYEEAMAAGQAAYKAAVAKPGVSVAEEVSSAHDASKQAALAAGVTAAEAETLAGAVANAVSGGAKEEIDTGVVTISPSEAAAATASQPAAESLEETPAERDAAEAGAEAARLAAAGGKSAQEQMDDAAVAAGRAAINGHMTPVGAVEAARKAATLAGINAGLSATEAARLGTEAAERAEVSGAFTAPNWREIATTPTTTPTTTTSSEENSTVAVVMARAGASSAGVAVAADSGNETIVVLTDEPPNYGFSQTLLWILLGAVLALVSLILCFCCGPSKTDKNGAKRAVDVEDVEEPSEDETSLLEPETSPKAKGPRVPMPQRKAEAPPVPTPPPVVSVPSRASSAAVATPLPALAPVTRTAAPVYTPPTPARAPVTTYTSYTYLPQAPQPQVQAPVTRVAPLMPRTAAASLFDALDVNGDGVLDKNEFAQLETLRGQQAAPVTTMPSEPVVRTTPAASVNTSGGIRTYTSRHT